MLQNLKHVNKVLSTTSLRCLATAAEPAIKDKKNGQIDTEDWNKAKPYSEIPGPKPLPIVGNVWRYVPGIGTYAGMDQLDIMRRQREEFGDIFKLSGMKIRSDMVFLFNPDDIAKLFRNDGQWPKRNTLEVFFHFTEQNPELYIDGYSGIFASDGKKWQDGRHVVNPILMQTKTVKGYVGPLSKAADKFLERIRVLHSQDPQGEMPENFIYELHKWSLESVTLISLNIELGLLDPTFSKDSESHDFITNILELFELLYKLDIRPSAWKYVSTPNYKKFSNCMKKLHSYTLKQIEEAVEKAKKEGNLDEPTIIKRLMKEEPKYLRGTIGDMLSAGVDTTSKTMGAVLHFLASNERVQDKLREEVMRVLPSPDTPITSQALDQMPYMRAVLKETFRISPIGVGNMRQTQKDLVFSGYQVPKGTNVISSNLLLCLQDKYFPQADQFLPERWLRKDGARETEINPWVYQPFGTGPRACIGKRLANLEIEILLVKIIRNFRMEWHHGEMKRTVTLMYGVASPLKIRMIPLEK